MATECVDLQSVERGGLETMKFEIEHNVTRPLKSGAKYPWGEMGERDAITVEEAYEKGKGSPAGSSAASWLKRNNPEWESGTWRGEPETGKVAVFRREDE